MKTPLCTMSKSETTSASNCKVIRDGEAGRRGARWQKVTFTLALKGLKHRITQSYILYVELTEASIYLIQKKLLLFHLGADELAVLLIVVEKLKSLLLIIIRNTPFP